MPEKLLGSVERVTFHNPETGFTVLRVKADGHRELVTIVGTLTSVTAGEQIEASGNWVVNRDHGRQFRAIELATSHPSSPDGIQRYLGSGAVRSVGPHLAERIVAMFKQQTLEIFNDHPDMLMHVRGIGKKRLGRIKQSWDEQRRVRRILLFLNELGLGGNRRAFLINRAYGDAAISLIKADPFRLANDIRGIGFKTADQLASRLGIDPTSPSRLQAGLVYALQQTVTEGHCGFSEAGLIDKAAELLGVGEPLLREALGIQVRNRAIVREELPEGPLVFLTSIHAAELQLAATIDRLAWDGDHPLPAVNVERAVAWLQERLQLQLSAGQRDAIEHAARCRFLVVTGGPGVGKTTLVRSLIELFEAKECMSVLAAPTGRAAKRLAETTGRTAKTVHRLLEFDPAINDFRRNQEHPLKGKLFVLDEASMMDVMLMSKYLRAIPSGACTVLVGDVDQLPSIGPGNVLADVICSRVVPVVRLQQIFRQAAESRIISSAYQINTGSLPHLEFSAELSDFYFVEAEEPERIIELIVRLVTERIPDRFGLDPFQDIQVLTPMNRSLLGTRNLNQILQERLNPPADQAHVDRFGTTFRVGDRVIQLENNYEKDVFNGDLGRIQAINRIEQTVTVAIDDREVDYDFADLDELALAYALSIHKSQGSEYPAVVIPMHTQHYVMLQRNLLYTAVTRGRQLVVIVGSKRALKMAVSRGESQQRITRLAQRLRALAERRAGIGE